MKKFIINGGSVDEKIVDITLPAKSVFDDTVTYRLEEIHSDQKEALEETWPSIEWNNLGNVSQCDKDSILCSLLYNKENIDNKFKGFSFSSPSYQIVTRLLGGSVIEFVSAYNYGPGTIMYVYLDSSNEFKFYIPYRGNWINLDDKTEIYQDPARDLSYLRKQGLDIDSSLEEDSDETIVEKLKYVFRKSGVKIDSFNYPSLNYDICRNNFRKQITR